jgi:cytochrome P450
MTAQDEILTYPPKRDSKCPFDPPKELLHLQKEKPIVRVRQWDGIEAWLVTRYEDAKTVFSDNRFSVNPKYPGFPEKSAAYKQIMGQDHNLRTMDSPEHAVQKRMLARDFTVRRLEEMRPAIQARVDSLIDNMLAKGPPAEIWEDLAFPVPTMVICELLGVPYQDRDYFAERSYVCTSHEVTAEEATLAGRELYDYLEQLVESKDKNPQNDLVSRLVVEQMRHGHLSRKDTIELARFILIAGHETTANTIALSTISLLQNPDQLAYLKQSLDDQAALTNSVDELLRYLSVAHTGRRRVAIADVMVGDQLIKAGEGVIIANNVADRDESIFPEADKLDLKRPNARANLAFGYGMHQCLGQLLSRVELQIVHSTLWRRMPTLALDIPFSELQFREDTPVYGVRAVPVTWKP